MVEEEINPICEYYNISKDQPQTVENIKIPKYAFIVLAGKRRCGKSIMIKHLVKHICDIDNIDFVVVFSNTAKFNNDYDMLPDKCIFEYKDAEVKLEKLIDYQKSKKKANRKKIGAKNIPVGIVVLDDITVHKKSDKIIDLASFGRHINLYVIISTQFPKDCVGPAIRNNLDIIFFNDLNFTGIEAIYQAMHINFSFKQIRQFVEFINEGQHFFVMYDNNEKDKRKRIQIVKADCFDDMKVVDKDKQEIQKINNENDDNNKKKIK
jgi:hypothetical protein